MGDIAFGSQYQSGSSTDAFLLGSGGFDLLTFCGDPEGVDFRDLEVTGIDLNNASSTVNFSLNGEGASGNATAEADRTLPKRIFLEALTIPNDEHFVDLQPGGNAVVSAAFKQTKTCELFFAADVVMKYDNVEFFWNRDDYNVLQRWFVLLEQEDDDLFYDLLGRGVVPMPIIATAGTIEPQIPSVSNDTDQVFIDDA